jgi:hypothetical protein
MATGLTASNHPRAPRWRSALAALISLALVLSFFHCCCVDVDEGILTVSAAQTSCDISGKTSPAAPAPHCCHCLAHATTFAPQDGAVAIEYVADTYRFTAVLPPEATDLDSPFKPPRA